MSPFHPKSAFILLAFVRRGGISIRTALDSVKFGELRPTKEYSLAETHLFSFLLLMIFLKVVLF
jgi:hypothetical protein